MVRRFVLLLLVAFAPTAIADPVVVRLTESAFRGSPVVRTPSGEHLADGDFVQTVDGDVVDSRLTLRFVDGSLHDEQSVFSQRGALQLLRHRLLQTGPSFPLNVRASLDRDGERYDVRYRDAGEARWRRTSGRFALPPDVYNGMVPTLVRQLPSAAGGHFHVIAFTPHPRLVQVRVTSVRDDQVVTRGRLVSATRFQLKPEVGGLASLFAADLPPVLCWVTRGETPRFAGFQGPLYYTGPVWRIEER